MRKGSTCSLIRTGNAVEKPRDCVAVGAGGNDLSAGEKLHSLCDSDLALVCSAPSVRGTIAANGGGEAVAACERSDARSNLRLAHTADFVGALVKEVAGFAPLEQVACACVRGCNA